MVRKKHFDGPQDACETRSSRNDAYCGFEVLEEVEKACAVGSMAKSLRVLSRSFLEVSKPSKP